MSDSHTSDGHTSDKESAHGKLSKIDQVWDGKRFLLLLFVTLGSALVIIFVIASLKTDFGWQPFAHDFVRHSLESSIL